MPDADDQEPPRWRQLCSQLRHETDHAKFEELLAEINRILTEHEKAKAAKTSLRQFQNLV
jgi:hypothetical protein